MKNMMFGDSHGVVSVEVEEAKNQLHTSVTQPSNSSAKVLSGLSSHVDHSRGFWREQLDLIHTAHSNNLTFCRFYTTI